MSSRSSIAANDRDDSISVHLNKWQTGSCFDGIVSGRAGSRSIDFEDYAPLTDRLGASGSKAATLVAGFSLSSLSTLDW